MAETTSMVAIAALTLEQRCWLLSNLAPELGLRDQLTETAESLMILTAELRFVLTDAVTEGDASIAAIRGLLAELERGA